ASTRRRWVRTGRRSAPTGPRPASGSCERTQRRVVQRDPVAPQRPSGCEERPTERPGELVERSPACGGDLAGIVGSERLVLGPREEDVRAPAQVSAVVAEGRVRRDEVALDGDAEASLLERLANRARDEVLAGLDAAAGRAPHVLGEMGLADERDALARVDDEERHVVRAGRVVPRERPFGVADLALPAQHEWVAVARTDGREH